MRIRRQPSARVQFTSEVLEFLFRYAPFEIRTRINSRGGMSLKINHISVATFISRVEKMIERNFVKRSCGRERRDVSADAFLNAIGAHHHGERVPAHQAFYP